MKTGKRHESLIPLSREHHYALMLCLWINRGLPTHAADTEWLERKSRQTVQFFDSELVLHFKAEEEVLFPAMQGLHSADEVIANLLDEHREIKGLVDQIRSKEGSSTATLLKEFAEMLEAHVRKEEHILFPMFEENSDADARTEVERGVRSLVGTAINPRHPELLDP